MHEWFSFMNHQLVVWNQWALFFIIIIVYSGARATSDLKISSTGHPNPMTVINENIFLLEIAIFFGQP